MEQSKLDRINFLAKKAREKGLTEAEKAEQKTLREEYIMSFFSRLFPKLTPRIISAVLKWSKLDLFDEVFH